MAKILEKVCLIQKMDEWLNENTHTHTAIRTFQSYVVLMHSSVQKMDVRTRLNW